jgi:predicted membrane protein
MSKILKSKSLMALVVLALVLATLLILSNRRFALQIHHLLTWVRLLPA